MIADNGRVKLLDFGVARAIPVETDIVPGSAQAPTLTAVGSAVGTVPYMSPEQLRGEVADARSDIWAFGCVFFEMLTGLPAFARGSGAETVTAIQDQPAPLELLPASTPRTVRTLLHRCLDKDPERRPESMREIASVLSRTADDLQPESRSSGLARRRRRIVAGGHADGRHPGGLGLLHSL